MHASSAATPAAAAAAAATTATALTYTSFEGNSFSLKFEKTGEGIRLHLTPPPYFPPPPCLPASPRPPGVNVLVDPWLVDTLTFGGAEAVYCGRKRVALPEAVDVERLAAEADFVLLTQGIDDHAHK